MVRILCLKTTIPSDLHCLLLTHSTFFQIPCGLLRVSTPKSFNTLCPLKLQTSSTLAGFGRPLLSSTSVFLHSCELQISSALRNLRRLPLLRVSVFFRFFKLPSASTLASFRFLLFLQASVSFHSCEFPLSSVSQNFSFRTEVSHSFLCLLRSFGFPASLEISISTSRD